MQTMEYDVIPVGPFIKKTLNDKAKDGWRLVGVSWMRVFLARPVNGN